MIVREALKKTILQQIQQYRVTALLGPRQCGKTTIAREIASELESVYFDLEDPECPLQQERAKLVLQQQKGLVVIDEIQLQPGLFSLLRVLSDDHDLNCRFLVLGSASPLIVKGISESLAGRVSMIEMKGFTINEISINKLNEHWIRGGFPLSFLGSSDSLSFNWRRNFVKTFLERDIPQLGIRVPAATLRRFWTMIAHYHGQIWNSAELARSLGTKEDTARRYLDILCGTYLLRQLPPWFENTKKRLVKSPKVYVRDTGLLHFLLGVDNYSSLLSHPKLGLSWEGYCIEQIIHSLDAEDDAYFYATYSGAELDLFILRKGKRLGFEFKYVDSPKVTRSMTTVLSDLNLDILYVVYPGTQKYPLKEKIELLPVNSLNNLPESVQHLSYK